MVANILDDHYRLVIIFDDFFCAILEDVHQKVVLDRIVVFFNDLKDFLFVKSSDDFEHFQISKKVSQKSLDVFLHFFIRCIFQFVQVMICFERPLNHLQNIFGIIVCYVLFHFLCHIAQFFPELLLDIWTF